MCTAETTAQVGKDQEVLSGTSEGQDKGMTETTNRQSQHDWAMVSTETGDTMTAVTIEGMGMMCEEMAMVGMTSEETTTGVSVTEKEGDKVITEEEEEVADMINSRLQCR